MNLSKRKRFVGVLIVTVSLLIVVCPSSLFASSALDWFYPPNYSSDGKLILRGNDQDYNLQLISAKEKKVIWKYVSQNKWYYGQCFEDIAWSPDNTRVLITDVDGRHALDVGSGKTIGLYAGLNAKDTFTPAWSYDGSLIACIGKKSSSDRSHAIVVWDVASQKINFDHADDIGTTVLWAPEGGSILFNNYDHTVQIWDVLKKEKLLSISVPARGLPPLAWSPDGRYFAIEDFANAVMYDAKSGSPVNEHQFDDIVGGFAWSPDGKAIAYGEYEKPQVWHLPFESGDVKRKKFKEKVLGEKGYMPQNLDECFTQLNAELEPGMIKELKSKNEDDLAMYHRGLGMWMRNYWGLWGGSKLAESFHKLDIWHPDDMSGIIITSYWRHLNGRPLELEKQAKEHIDYWAKQKSEHK